MGSLLILFLTMAPFQNEIRKSAQHHFSVLHAALSESDRPQGYRLHPLSPITTLPGTYREPQKIYTLPEHPWFGRLDYEEDPRPQAPRVHLQPRSTSTISPRSCDSGLHNTLWAWLQQHSIIQS